MNIKMNQKMDLHNAVEHLSAIMPHRYAATFIDTEFGKIGIELARDYNPMRPIVAKRWKDGPTTSKFYINNLRTKTDYYVAIGFNYRYKSRTLTKLEIAWALCQCMVLHLADLTKGYVSESQIELDANVLFLRYVHDMRNDMCADVTGLAERVMRRDMPMIKFLDRRGFNMAYTNLENTIKSALTETKDRRTEIDKMGAEYISENPFNYEHFWMTYLNMAITYFMSSKIIFGDKKKWGDTALKQITTEGCTAMEYINMLGGIMTDMEKLKELVEKTETPVVTAEQK